MSSGQTFLLSSSLACLVALYSSTVCHKHTTQHPCTGFITHSPPACSSVKSITVHLHILMGNLEITPKSLYFSHLIELVRNWSTPPSMAGIQPHDFIYCRFHNPGHLFLPTFSQETLKYFSTIHFVLLWILYTSDSVIIHVLLIHTYIYMYIYCHPF